jgi:hypothetical protein
LLKQRIERARLRDEMMARTEPPAPTNSPTKAETRLPKKRPPNLRIVFSDRDTGDAGRAKRRGLFVRVKADGVTCVAEDRNARGSTRRDCTLDERGLDAFWSMLRAHAFDQIATESYGRMLGRVARRYLYVSWGDDAHDIDEGETGTVSEADFPRWARIVYEMRRIREKSTRPAQ